MVFQRICQVCITPFHWPNLLLLRLKHVTAWVNRGRRRIGGVGLVGCSLFVVIAVLWSYLCYFALIAWFFFSLHVTQYWNYQLNKGRCSREKFAALDLYCAGFQYEKRKNVEERWNGRLLSSRHGSENALKDRISSLWHYKSSSTALDTVWANPWILQDPHDKVDSSILAAVLQDVPGASLSASKASHFGTGRHGMCVGSV